VKLTSSTWVRLQLATVVFSALVDIRRDPPRLIFGGGEPLCIKSAPSAIMAAAAC
jgi:hypothetical protein